MVVEWPRCVVDEQQAAAANGHGGQHDRGHGRAAAGATWSRPGASRQVRRRVGMSDPTPFVGTSRAVTRVGVTAGAARAARRPGRAADSA